MRSLLFALVLFPALAHADIYTWIDENGVTHFTNIPPKGTKAAKKLYNTYEWSDGSGTLRTVHRANYRKYDDIIIEAARYYSLPPALVKAVTAAESAFEPNAISHAGAQGLMQLMPATAREMHVSNTFDPRENIYGGARYLRLMANRFQGDLKKTLAAYNAGPGAVEKYNGVPNYEETKKYVRRVIDYYNHYLETWNVD